MKQYSEIETERVEALKNGTGKVTVPRSDWLAMLRMLVKRATLIDRWRASKECNHWLNVAKREIAIG